MLRRPVRRPPTISNVAIGITAALVIALVASSLILPAWGGPAKGLGIIGFGPKLDAHGFSGATLPCFRVPAPPVRSQMGPWADPHGGTDIARLMGLVSE